MKYWTAADSFGQRHCDILVISEQDGKIGVLFFTSLFDEFGEFGSLFADGFSSCVENSFYHVSLWLFEVLTNYICSREL